MIPVPEAPDSLFEPIRGEQFAHGQHRTVHHVNGCPDLVMKVDSINSTFANWSEYLISSALSGRSEPVASLMGSVRAISATGKYLLMERLGDVDRPLSGIQYPMWLNDTKRSAFGVTTSGVVKVRDYGTLKLADVLAPYVPLQDGAPALRIVPSGQDEDYSALSDKQIDVDAGRTVHEVKGHPSHVLKVCVGSHRANRIEFLTYWALEDTNEREYFGSLECSRSGKHLIMERLPDLPRTFTGTRPPPLWWLVDQSDRCLGVTPEGNAKLRSYCDIRLGDLLTRAPLKMFP